MDLSTHREERADGKQERSPSRGPGDTPAHFFAETSPSSETGKGKDLSHTFKEFYQSKEKLQAISKQVHSEILSEIQPLHAALQEGEDLDLSDCAKAGAFLPRLDLPNYTQEGVLIPREQRRIASPMNKEASSLSDEHILRIQGIHSTVVEYTSDFYFKKEGPEKMWSAIIKAHQVAHVLTHAQLCEHAFQDQLPSFEPKMAEKIQQEFRKRRNKIEQHMGFPDILRLLKQGRKEGSTHEQKGFLSDAMHTRLNDEYHEIEALPYNRARLEALDGFAEKLLSAQRVFALTGKTADHVWSREVKYNISSRKVPGVQKLRKEIFQRAVRMAETEGWEEVRETVTKFLTDQQIDQGVRGCAAKELGGIWKHSSVEMSTLIVPDLVGLLDKNDIPWQVRDPIAHAIGEIGKQCPVEMRKSIAQDLVGLLDKNDIPSRVRNPIAHAIGAIGDASIVPDLVGLLDKNDIPWVEHHPIDHAIGEIGKQSSVEVRKSIAQYLVGLFDKNDISGQVYDSIARAIGVIGDASIVPDLKLLLDKNNIDRSVKVSITGALEKIESTRQL